MTDESIADNIVLIMGDRNGKELFEETTVVLSEKGLSLVAPSLVNQYYLKKNNAIVVEIPKLSNKKNFAIAQIALAVGRRLERFERGRKANAGRTAESRQKIAQKAIQARWNAK